MTKEPIQTQQPLQPQYSFEEDTISLMDLILILVSNLKLIIIIPSSHGVSFLRVATTDIGKTSDIVVINMRFAMSIWAQKILISSLLSSSRFRHAFRRNRNPRYET